MIRVAVVEDRPEIREGLARLLNGTRACRAIACYRSMEETIAGIGADLPDVLLVDLGLPGMSGIEGLRILRRSYPDLALLVLTIHEDDDRIFAALCAGATGYLLKKMPPARLLESIEEAVRGGAPMSPEIARRVVEFFHARKTGSAPPPLSPQEKRLLRLLVEGHHYKTAAAELGISVNTVSFHLRRIYDKLQVHSKSEAVAKALRHGLVR